MYPIEGLAGKSIAVLGGKFCIWWGGMPYPPRPGGGSGCWTGGAVDLSETPPRAFMFIIRLMRLGGDCP